MLLGITERRGGFEVAGLVDAVKTQHDPSAALRAGLVSGLREMLNVPITAQVEPRIRGFRVRVPGDSYEIWAMEGNYALWQAV